MVTTRSVWIVFVFLALILLASFGCDRAQDTPRQPLAVVEGPADTQNPDIAERNPIMEIWWERDGSVPIRGKSLHFRMYDDRAVEFDYLVSRESTRSGRVEFSFRRTPPTMISEEEFARISSAAGKLLENKNLKAEYGGPVALTLDTTERFTVLVYEDGALKKTVVVNDSDYAVFSEKFAKVFPRELAHLLREVRSFLDVRTAEFTGCRPREGFTGLNCPNID